MMGIARGICLIITTGTPLSLVNKLPAAFRYLGAGSIGGFPVIVIISVILFIIADILFRKSPLLRQVYYSGSNQKAAVFSGIKVVKVKLLVYVFSSFLCGIAGLLFLARFSYASPIAWHHHAFCHQQRTDIARCICVLAAVYCWNYSNHCGMAGLLP
jgi:ribose transport system permease protein